MRRMALLALLACPVLVLAQSWKQDKGLAEWVYVLPKNEPLPPLALMPLVDQVQSENRGRMLLLVFRKDQEVTRKGMKDLLFECIPPFMSDQLMMQVFEYHGDDSTIISQGLKSQSKNDTLPGNFRQSKALLLCPEDWTEEIEGHTADLGLMDVTTEYQRKKHPMVRHPRYTLYELSSPFVYDPMESSPKDYQFCWNLHRLLDFIERKTPEVKRKKEVTMFQYAQEAPMVRVSLGPVISGRIQEPLSEWESTPTMEFNSPWEVGLQVPLFSSDSLYATFPDLHFGLSLGSGGGVFDSMWQDQERIYTGATKPDALSEVRVQNESVVERVSIPRLNTVSFPLTISTSMSDNEGIWGLFTIKPGIILPGVIQSELVSGSFSYTGVLTQVPGLVVHSVPALGLANDVPAVDYAAEYTPFTGRTLSVSAEAMYVADLAGLGIGLDANWMTLRTQSSAQVDDFGTIGTYTSSVDGDQVDFFQLGLRFSIMFSLKNLR